MCCSEKGINSPSSGVVTFADIVHDPINNYVSIRVQGGRFSCAWFGTFWWIMDWLTHHRVRSVLWFSIPYSLGQNPWTQIVWYNRGFLVKYSPSRPSRNSKSFPNPEQDIGACWGGSVCLLWWIGGGGGGGGGGILPYVPPQRVSLSSISSLK